VRRPDDIETLDGKVIDGRRRLKACEMAGVEPRFRGIITSDPITYVLSKQNRRDLTPSQRAMCGARAVELRKRLEEEAKERQREGQKSGGRGHKKNFPATVPESLPENTSGTNAGSEVRRHTRPDWRPGGRRR